MTWNWDVKTTTKPAIPDDAVARSVNLMCYLLHNITYNQLYNSALTGVLWRLQQNLKSMPRSLNSGAVTAGFDVKGELSKCFKSIEDALDSDTSIKLRTFFEVYFRSDSARYSKEISIVEAIESIHTNNPDEMAVFCTPFMAFQQSSNPSSPLDPTNQTGPFLKALGNLTLFDLYTYHEPLDEYGNKGPIRIAVEKGRKDGILNFLRGPIQISNGPIFIATPPSNNRKCSGGHCVLSTTPSWCNEDENGNCTVAGG